MSAAAFVALRAAPDELTLVAGLGVDRVAGRKLASGIFRSPAHLASGLERVQPANDTGENQAACDEGTSESCFYANNDPVNYVDRTGRRPEDGEEGGSAESEWPESNNYDDDAGLCSEPDDPPNSCEDDPDDRCGAVEDDCFIDADTKQCRSRSGKCSGNGTHYCPGRAKGSDCKCTKY